MAFFEILQNGLVLAGPFICVTVILVCSLFFAFLFFHSREALYLRFLLLNLNTLLFTATEILILILGGLEGNWQVAIQIHRLEQIIVAFYLLTVPLFLQAAVERGSPLRPSLKILTWLGLGLSLGFGLVAFLAPELFVSVTRHSQTWQTVIWDHGRGQEGFLYLVRDILLGLTLLYAVVSLIIEALRTKAYSFYLPLIAGFLFAIWFAASDVLKVHLRLYIDPFAGIVFSRTPVGVTIFLVLGMLGVFKRFLDQNVKLAQAYGALRESDARLAESNELMNRFVPIEFLTYLEKSSVQEVRLGDCRKMYMTVLFSDIRSFTRISESMTPEENFAFINEYLSVMVPIIRDFDGFVDKFIGDAIMALFPGGPNDAVRAAVAMRRGLVELNALRRGRGQEEIDIGIGINSGELMIGTVGDNYRMEGTVISDAVNLASRMENLTKMYNLAILMSGESFQELVNPLELNTRFIGQSRVKGKTAPIAVFEIFDGDEESLIELKRKTHSEFERAVIALYSGRFTEAVGHFETVLASNPRDGAADYYRRWLLKKREGKQAVQALLRAEMPA